MFGKRRVLKCKKDEHSLEELKQVENKLSELCAEENFKIINESCEGLACEEGGINMGKL